MASALPAIEWLVPEPRLRRHESSSLSGGRLTNVVEYADPVWLIDMQSPPLHIDSMRQLEAWLNAQRGALRSVLFRHPYYKAPLAHRRNSAPAQQAGTLSALPDRSTATVTGVNAGLVLQAGDFITFASGAFRALGMVSSVSGSGTSRTVSLEPALARHIPIGATVQFDRVELVTRIVTGSWTAPERVEGPIFQAGFQLIESRT